MKKKIYKIILDTATLILIYVVSYVLNSFLGGYWPVPERDGRDKLFSFGFSATDAILWQPRFGHESLGNLDYLGAFYTPLIRLDRKYIHPTLYMSDEGFDKKLSQLKLSQIHPHWRDEFATKITATVTRDSSQKGIHFSFHYTGSTYARAITEIRMPLELAKTLQVAPPVGFVEEAFKDSQKYEKEHDTRWVGKIVLSKDQDVVLTIPAANPMSGAGNVRFYYERTDPGSEDQRNICFAELK